MNLIVDDFREIFLILYELMTSWLYRECSYFLQKSTIIFKKNTISLFINTTAKKVVI